jgi:hypothetical protein
MGDDETIRIFVGADRSQKLAIDVLEYSIRRHTQARVQIIPMVDLAVPEPKDPRNWQRTGFSYSRFCIPKLAGYSGKAIYMDADMQVFKDITRLWELPLNGAKVLVQSELKHLDTTMEKKNAPAQRIKQCAVMVLDCGRLDWDISSIVQDMDAGRYGYEELMYQLCILKEHEIGYSVPFEWNSLEYFDIDTCLTHYTDMGTQPWVSCGNPLGEIWYSEVRRMLAEGALGPESITEEIRLGFFRPSLMRDVRHRHQVPKILLSLFDKVNAGLDSMAGFTPHKMVYAKKRERGLALKASEMRLRGKTPP